MSEWKLANVTPLNLILVIIDQLVSHQLYAN